MASTGFRYSSTECMHYYETKKTKHTTNNTHFYTIKIAYNPMQVATLSYHYNPKGNFHNDSRSKFQHRHILTTIKNPQKKLKQRRSFLSDISTKSNATLPPIKTTGKRPSSIRIKGSGLTSSKLNDTSTLSLNQPSRSRSRQSEKSDARSRSVTPSGGLRSTSRLVRLKFGYPVKLRSSKFYAPNLSESELRFREDSFVNDSIRSANQHSHSKKIPQYESLDDSHLRSFFQSSLVLDAVRKTLNLDVVERSSAIKKQSKTNDRDGDYRRIVAKHSSGYGKLNGYACIPAYAPARHTRSSSRDKHLPSANSSLTSFPTYSNNQFQQKQKSRRNDKMKKLTPIATSSPLRHPIDGNNEVTAVSSASQE